MLDRYLSLNNEASNKTKAAVWWLKGLANEQLDHAEKARECYVTSLSLYPEFTNATEALQRPDAAN